MTLGLTVTVTVRLGRGQRGRRIGMSPRSHPRVGMSTLVPRAVLVLVLVRSVLSQMMLRGGVERSAQPGRGSTLRGVRDHGSPSTRLAGARHSIPPLCYEPPRFAHEPVV